MCDPVLLFGAAASAATATAPAIAVSSGLFGTAGAFTWGATLSTLGAVGGGLSSIMAGQQQSANLTYQANMANYNAKVAENNALSAQYAAEHERQMFEDRYRRQVLAKQAPAYAISGVVGTAGTPLMVQAESYMAGLEEEAAIKYTGQTAAAAKRQEAIGQRYAAVNYMSGSGRARTAGYLGAGKSLLSLGKALT
jgi:hypothetical protein